MQKIIIYYVIPGTEETQSIELVDLTSFKETFLNGRQEIQFSCQDTFEAGVLKTLMNASIQKITMEKYDSENTLHLIDFEAYPVFEKISQDYKGIKIVTTFQSMNVYNS